MKRTKFDCYLLVEELEKQAKAIVQHEEKQTEATKYPEKNKSKFQNLYDFLTRNYHP